MIQVNLDADFISAMKRVSHKVIVIKAMKIEGLVVKVICTDPEKSAWQGHKE